MDAKITAHYVLENLSTFSETQFKSFCDTLAKSLSEEDILIIKKAVGIYKLFNDIDKYNAMRDAIGQELYKEFTKDGKEVTK